MALVDLLNKKVRIRFHNDPLACKYIFIPVYKIHMDEDENQEDMHPSSQQLKLIRVITDLHVTNLL